MPRASERAKVRDAMGSKAGEPKESTLPAERKLLRLSTVATTPPKAGLRMPPIEDLPPALLSLGDEAAIGKLYGLTRKEAELAAVILKGKSVDEAAAELAISPDLARNHLRRIFMKADMSKTGMRPRTRTAK